MTYTAKIRLSEESTLVISFDESNSKATITEANSGKTGTATLSGGSKNNSKKKEAE